MALKCYENMKRLKIRASNVTYSILAKIYDRLGLHDRVLGILDEMAKDGLKPGVFVFTCII
jgi:pentatricopeptide repeat protein